jgi:hypothetical protein
LTANRAEKGSKLYLTGNFQRLNDQFEVNLQLTDITTWKTSEQQKVTVKTSDLAKIIEAVNQAAAGLIDPALRPPDSETAATAARIEREMQSFRETTAATRKITFEVEKLTGLYSEKATLKPGTEKPVVHRNEGVLATEFSRKLSESLSRSATFEEILRRLVDNPYKLEIGDPEFRRVTLNDKMVRMAFGVRFALNRELIDEMLSTLAYDSRTSHDKYTEYQFNGDKFIIQENLLREIALGEFRTYPVVSFINSDGTVAYSLIDVPVVFSRNIKPRSDVKFVAYYQPLFNVTAHVTSVKIQLNNEDREIRYEVELSLEQLSRIDRINVTFLPESGLLEYLNNAD